MAAKLPVWGIDLGQSALKAVRLAPSGEQIEIQELFVHEHATMLSASEADSTSLIRASLEALIAKHDVRKEPVVVAVPGQMTLTRYAKMPPVEPKKIPDMVNYEAQQQIPFDMDEVVWDYEIFSDKESPDVEVGIFAIRKELVRGHLAHFQSVGIEPILAQSAPLATFNALKTDGQLAGDTTLLIDIGAVATDLIIVEGGNLWSRVIPMGGNSFTEALVRSFKLTFKKAEDLKRTAASSKYARQILQAMRPVFADLVAQIQQSVGFYTSTRRQAEIKRVIGMGRAFLLPGLGKFLQQNLQLQVDKFAGFTKAVPGPIQKSPAYQDAVVSLTVAYGAALQGLGVTTITSSLLPLEVVRQQMWRKKRVFFGASAACVAAAAGAVWLGNMLASNALAAKAGNVTNPNLPTMPLERAMQLYSSPPSKEKPLEYAQQVGGALETLKAEYGKVATAESERGRINLIVSLPKENVVIPQIMDLIQRVFSEAAGPQLRDVKSSEEYVELARRVPRNKRNEVWIDQIRCKYDPRDAAKAFSVQAPTRGEASDPNAQGGASAGWTFIIDGRTTSANANQLMDDISSRLISGGRQKGLSWWVKTIPPPKLNRATPKTGARQASPASPTTPVSRDRDERSGVASPAAPIRPPPTAGGVTLKPSVEMIKPKAGIDPVTGESTTGDYAFQLVIVVAKGAVPAEMIPKAGSTTKPSAEPPPETEAPARPSRPVDRD